MSSFEKVSGGNKDFVDPESLQNADFNATTLRKQGFTLDALVKCQFEADQLIQAGFSVIELRCAGFDVALLREGGCCAIDCASAGFTHQQLRRGGFTAAHLKEDLKLGARACKQAGYTCKEMIKVGFIANEMKIAGFTASEIADSCSAGEMLRAGFTKDVLKPLGKWEHDGDWQIYNQYWSCCHSLDSESTYCQNLTEKRRSIK